MLSHNPKLKRIELAHPDFASPSQVERLKSVMRNEMSRTRSTRGVMRVLTDEPSGDESFRIEAKVATPKGVLTVFGFNIPPRIPDEATLHRETTYLARVLCSRNFPRNDFDIVRLKADERNATELSALYARIYSSYPVGLDRASFSKCLEDLMPYAVMEGGKITAALFGAPVRFGDLSTVEFALSAMPPSARGIDMTTALAARIRAEAIERFGDPLMLAETIAAPVMHSCNDLGMKCSGVLREHYDMVIGDKRYTNLYLWSL
jgi:hypothetical protein